jgi:hypothetical protein
MAIDKALYQAPESMEELAETAIPCRIEIEIEGKTTMKSKLKLNSKRQPLRIILPRIWMKGTWLVCLPIFLN